MFVQKYKVNFFGRKILAFSERKRINHEGHEDNNNVSFASHAFHGTKQSLADVLSLRALRSKAWQSLADYKKNECQGLLRRFTPRNDSRIVMDSGLFGIGDQDKVSCFLLKSPNFSSILIIMISANLKEYWLVGLYILIALIALYIAIDYHITKQKIREQYKILLQGFCPTCLGKNCRYHKINECMSKNIAGISKKYIHAIFENAPLCNLDNLVGTSEIWSCERSYFLSRFSKETYIIQYDNNDKAATFFVPDTD